MIDFRYHLVSIASVFLALAVGIVLGAGPLKGTLGDTLASEVAQLRSDADSLRGSLADAEAGVTARDDVLSAVGPLSVAGTLSGTSVSILALPGSPDNAYDSARASLEASGAAIAAQVRVDESWTSQDPPDVTDRTTAAAELRTLLAGDLPVGIDPERVIALALGWALAVDPTAGPAESQAVEGGVEEPAQTAGPTSETPTADSTTTAPEQSDAATSARILEILAANGLVTVEGDSTSAVTDAVVIIAPVAGDDTAEQVPVWSDLVAAVDEAGSVLVVGDLGVEAEAESDLISSIRASSDLSGRISTVDDVVTPAGRLAVPFAVAEQLAGDAGHYGALGSAARFFPPVPETP